jgi:hypothetical protein
MESIEVVQAAITKQAALVRELKKEGAVTETVQAAVAELASLRKQLEIFINKLQRN